MFNKQSAYINLFEEEVSNSTNGGRKFIASALLVASVATVSLQAGFVLNASAANNPISSPVSTQESPTPTPSASVNPVTAPEVTPTPSSQPSNNGGGNSGGGSSNSGGGSSSAPSCNNEAPKAPKIVSATSAGKNEITLNWEKAQGPVTHYAIVYGFLKGQPLYGNTNIGNVTSFTVKGLSAGVTYYFQVQAVNDCTPGAYSNEIGIKGGGKVINTPAQGFKPNVLGKVVKFQGSTPSGKPALAKPIVFSADSFNKPANTGLIGKVFGFIANLF